jgi:hypothetical protein
MLKFFFYDITKSIRRGLLLFGDLFPGASPVPVIVPPKIIMIITNTHLMALTLACHFLSVPLSPSLSKITACAVLWCATSARMVTIPCVKPLCSLYHSWPRAPRTVIVPIGRLSLLVCPWTMTPPSWVVSFHGRRPVKKDLGWEGCLVKQYLPSVHGALGLIPNNALKKKKRTN